ncbi:MAG: DUF2892 domain-containing protein [Ginsengibacter sp.]
MDIVLLVLGGVFILTSSIGFCPLYAIVKMNTCSNKKTILIPGIRFKLHSNSTLIFSFRDY